MNKFCLALTYIFFPLLILSGCNSLDSNLTTNGASSSLDTLSSIIPTISESSSSQPPLAVDDDVLNFLLCSGVEPPYDAPLEEIVNATTNFYKSTWNPSTGAISVNDTDPVLVTSGRYRGLVATWDGDENLMVKSKDSITNQSGEINLSLLDYPINIERAYGDDYYIEISTDGDVRFVNAVDDTVVDFPSVTRSFEFDETELSWTNNRIWNSHYDGENLHIIFFLMNPKDSLDVHITYLALNTNDLSVSWMKPIPFPNGYDSSAVIFGPTDTAFIANRFYFSGGNTILYLDLDSGEIKGLEAITDQLDTLIPNTHRTQFEGREAPTTPCGNTNDVAICYIPYDSNSTDDIYIVYYAVRGDELIGVICYMVSDEEAILTTYDGTLQKINSQDLSYIPMRNAPIIWQSTNYS